MVPCHRREFQRIFAASNLAQALQTTPTDNISIGGLQ
jgi:hypothetical protein